jgi:hypothetical protein
MVAEPKTLEEAAANSYALCRESLIAFTRFTYPHYQVAKHHRIIADALQKLESGEIKRLILNIGPQRGKTELATVRFIPWWLGRNPDRPVIAISYGSDPVERFSRNARDVMKSEEYARVFPGITLDAASQSVTYWQIKGHRGGLRAASIGGAVTSFPADLIIIDDPHKDVQTAESEAERKQVLDFYTGVAYNRLSPDGRILIIQTRWVENDLTGHVLEQQKHGGDAWTIITIPAVANPEIEVDDDGREIYVGGDPLWPERWSLDDYNRIRRNIGERDWQAQYMCQPSPPEGSLFKKSWFTISPRAPDGLQWVRAWDLATTEKETGSFTAGALLAVDVSKTIWIRDFRRGQWEWPEARRRIMTQASIDGPDVRVLIEEGAFQFGKLAQDIIDNWEDIRIPVQKIKVRGLGDKPARARPWAARAEAGRVVLVGDSTTPWIEHFLNEAASFPYGQNNDMIDAVSLGFETLASSPIGAISESIPPHPDTWNYFKTLGGIEDPGEEG